MTDLELIVERLRATHHEFSPAMLLAKAKLGMEKSEGSAHQIYKRMFDELCQSIANDERILTGTINRLRREHGI